MSRGSSFQTRLGLGNTIPGPYQEPMSLYDANRFKDRDSFVVAHSGDRAGGDLGRRNSVYATLPDRNTTRNFTNLSDQVEKEMGNCVPGRQDTAPAYGVPGNPNIFTSYPILSPFENRRKWTENFNVPFQPALPSKDNQMMGNKNQGGDLHSRHPVVPKQQPILLGSNLISDGIDQYYHRMTYLNRWFDEDDGEILIQTPKSMQNKYTGQYGDELFKTPIDNTENKISTGIMTNPWTGEMYETFENAMPPPNADKHIPKDRFEIANPKLLQMFGGLDPHAPLPKKKEICLSVPGSDHGNNVWGDQLYEEERRKRIIQEIGRELFNNRTGDSSTATAFAKEKPAGFVGLQPMYRALPYLPPVIDLDNHGYMPVTDYQAPESNMIKAEVSVRKPDLTTCPFQYAAGPLNDQPVEYVVTQYTNRPTNRGGGDQYYAGVPYWSNNNTVGPQQTQNKSTLKEFMEQPMTTGSQYNQTLSTGGNGYVVSQTQNKSTLKEFMEQPMTTGSQYNQTLSTGGNGYVVSQTQNKSTLKEFMEQPMTTGSQYNQTLSTGGNGYVVSQTQNKSTLKEFMEQPMTTGSQYNQTLSTGGNGYVVSQTQNKPTLKEFMEQPMTTGSQYNQTLSTGGNGYVVTQTQNKSTLKEFMEQAFDMGNFSDGGDNFTGGYIDFQGPVLETARAYYEYLPAVGRPANFSDGVGGDFVGNGIVTSRQNRGTDSLDWVTLSKVPQDAEDTSVTWIGVYDRDTKRELAPNIPMSDLAPSYESVAGRMFGALTPKCNLDLHQTQDEWLWSAGFAPQMPDVITG
jgi:regulatory protein YycI of two-component signal transduction system YycFG